MKVKVSLYKNGAALYEAAHEIFDAESFGRAFADAWTEIQHRRLQKTTSVGALMEVLNEDVVDTGSAVAIGCLALLLQALLDAAQFRQGGSKCAPRQGNRLMRIASLDQAAACEGSRPKT